MADQDQRQQPQLGLRLELTEPNRTESGWELKAIATLAKGRDPAPNERVQLYLDGMSTGDPEVTDGEGRAMKEFLDLQVGTHTFEAQIVGTTVKSRQTKNLKDEKPKKPANLIVDQSGRNKKYVLVFQVLTEDDRPVQGAVIRITDQDDPNGFYDLKPTGPNGTTERKIEFTAHEKILGILVLGTTIRRWKNLF